MSRGDNIIIRKPEHIDEIKQVKEIIEVSFPEWHAYYAVKGLKNHRLLVAIDSCSRRVVGFIQYKVVSSGRVRIGHMYYMAVHPDYRGRGIGTRLVEMCEHELLRLNVDVIIASTQEDNVPVIKIFRKLGYILTDWSTAAHIVRELGGDIEDEVDLMWLVYDYDEIVLLKVVKQDVKTPVSLRQAKRQA